MSCKSNTSNERCQSLRIKGLTLCGRHVKSKSVRLWNVVNNLDSKVTLISKAWRGYAVRIRLRRAGPGVLKRSLCHNDEELVTMDSKDKYHPFDFFSFELHSQSKRQSQSNRSSLPQATRRCFHNGILKLIRMSLQKMSVLA